MRFRIALNRPPKCEWKSEQEKLEYLPSYIMAVLEDLENTVERHGGTWEDVKAQISAYKEDVAEHFIKIDKIV